MTRRAISTRALWGAAIGVAGATLVAQAAAAATTTPCTALAGTFPDGATLKISQKMGYTGKAGTPVVLGIQAQDVPANMLSPPEPSPAVCEVSMDVSSVGDATKSQIAIGVLLPEGTVGTHSAAAWNGRFLGTGNGGFAGSVAASTLGFGLIPAYVVTGKTYVVANTDMGTGLLFNCNGLYCGSTEGVTDYPNQTPGGLYGDAAAINDFGYGATHLMTIAGQVLTGIFYGKHASYSYFHGCSTGGQQALMEAQRFPDDYDGILAGSPAYDRTHLHIGGPALYEATHFGPVDSNGLPDSYLTNEALALGHAGVLAQCAGADGGLPTDTYLTRPPLCKFSATALQCTGASGEVPCTDPTGTSCTCLTTDQTTALNQLWKGARDSDNRALYPGYERGTEDPTAALGASTTQALTEPAFDSLMYWAFGPNFQWQSLFKNTTSLQGELASKIDAFDSTPVGTDGDTFASVLNANNANLSAFKAHGGKLIMYAGYEDPLIPSASTIDYYNQALVDDPTTPGYAALYLAPGMWHCSGGPGVNAFGNLSSNLPPIPTSPTDDIMGALLQWREAGVAPGSIVATKYTNDDATQGIAFQRPLCVYPQDAAYLKGKNPNVATSYVCKRDGLVKNQEFTPIYGPQ
jgi:feruloyl esterase